METVTVLAGQVAGFLTPFMPQLLSVGGGLAGRMGEGLDAHKGELARALWDKLGPKFKTKPAAREAAEDVATQPQNEDLQAVLRVQVAKLLSDDGELLASVKGLMDSGERAGIVTTVTASGKRSVAAGGDISGTVTTGGTNTVKGEEKK